MTEEEIRPIAEQYVEEYCHCSDGEYTDGSLICAGIGTALIVARRLEKENTELKENYRKRGDIIISLERQLRLIIHSDQLTQAKELLKKIEKIVYNGENEIKRLSKIVDILAEAEQFLKEV